MAGKNLVILIGNLGKDPEVRYTQAGLAVAKFSLATNEKRKKGDDWVDDVQWHRVTFFGKLAEICGEYLTKGKQIYLEGRIQYGSYEKDGQTVYTTDIIGQNMVMLGGGNGGSGGGGRRQREAGGDYEDPYEAHGQGRGAVGPVPPVYESMEDDIPF
jgi:single-strand DNA-binding protein